MMLVATLSENSRILSLKHTVHEEGPLIALMQQHPHLFRSCYMTNQSKYQPTFPFG